MSMALLIVDLVVTAALIAGMFALYTVKANRKHRDLKEYIRRITGDIGGKGDLTAQNLQLEDRLGNAKASTLTVQHNQLSQEIIALNITMDVLVAQAQEAERKSQALVTGEKKIADAVAVLAAFEGLLETQALQLEQNKKELKSKDQALQELEDCLMWEKSQLKSRNAEIESLRKHEYECSLYSKDFILNRENPRY